MLHQLLGTLLLPHLRNGHPYMVDYFNNTSLNGDGTEKHHGANGAATQQLMFAKECDTNWHEMPLSKASQLEKMLKRQDYKCALSGKELTPQNAAIDHIVPLSKGGSHYVSNAQILLADVNSAKGQMTNDEFIAMCRSIVDHATTAQQGTAQDSTRPSS